MSGRVITTFIGLGLALLLAACGDGGWFGGPSKPKIEGERIAVLPQEQSIEADPRLADLRVQLPPPEANADAPLPGGVASHAMGNLAGGSDLAILWRTNIGEGSSRDGRLSSSPVVAKGRVYVVDANTHVSAIDAATGDRQWRVDLTPEEDTAGGGGGGVAVDQDRIYVTTGYAQVVALEASNGGELWRTSLTAPIRGGPTVVGGRVFVVTIDNQSHGLDASTGRRLWSHSGLTETAGLYGGTSPAVSGMTVIAPYSSGELFALRADNGRVLWVDSLAGIQRTDPVSALSDIRGLPVVDRGQVLAASNGGRLVAIDLRSGGRIWDQNIASIYTPWVAGDFLFITTIDGEVLCVTRREGRVRWVQPLQRYKDPEDRKGRLLWTGPAMVNGRLVVAGSLGEAVVIAADSGEIVKRIRLSGPVLIQPVVAGGQVFVLTEEADLIALR